MPLLSVVIPTRNRAGLIAETIESAAAAGSDLEIIVVDDASTDETPEILGNRSDIRTVRLGHRSGSARARNAGIQASSAEFIAFLDDDDLRLPGSLDQQIAALRDTPEAAVCYGRALVGDSSFSLPTGHVIPDRLHSGDIYWPLLEANFVPMPTVVARRACLLEAGLFDTRLRVREDYDLWVRIAERHHFVAVDRPVAIYRANNLLSGQKTSNRALYERERRRFVQQLLSTRRARAADPSLRRRVRNRHMTIVYNSLIHDAAEAMVESDVASARSFLVAAMRLEPLRLRAPGTLVSMLCRNLAEKLS